MAPAPTSRRRSRTVFEEDGEDQSSDSQSPRRPRLTSEAESSATEEDAEDGTAGMSQRSRRKVNGTAQTNGASGNSGFQPGAIVRVMVDNFVTYEHAQFLPGPNLNMIIGPNGTGKSSLVCAICLGLGYHPKHLGRATSVGEFVKHGKDVATIEIELQKKLEDRQNPVIRVQINREDNGRRWWVNGRESTHKAVQSLTRNLRIQIDNLCQFLPQDKVAEFAGLTPVQLLHETLRAAAPEKMIQWQTDLRELHQDHKKLKETAEQNAEQLQAHESRQQGLQADVDRLREREQIQGNIKDLQRGHVLAEYNEVRELYKVTRNKKKLAEKRYKELEQASGPAVEAVNQKKDYQARIEVVVSHRQKAVKDSELAADQIARTIDTHTETHTHLETKREAERTSHETTKTAIGKIRKQITDLEGKMKTKPPEFNADDWNPKIREQERILRESEAEKRQLGNRLQELGQAARPIKANLDRLKIELENLESSEGQQLSHLKSINPDAAKGWEWLQKNQDKFEKEVFGPPMLTCSVKDKAYSNLIQALLQADDFMCFTTQCKEDHKTLSNYLFRDLGLSATVRTCSPDAANLRPPMSTAEAQALGLDGFAIEYLEGPAPVLAMLCSEKRLHLAGVAEHDVSNEQYEKLSKSNIQQWASGPHMYRITRRREYGPDAVSSMTRKINPGRFWTDRQVDNAEKTALEARIREVRVEFEELRKENIDTKEKVKELNDSEDEIQQQIEQLKRDKSELQVAFNQWANLPNKIAFEKSNLETQQNALSECRQRIAEIGSQQEDEIIEKAEAVLRHKDAVAKICEAHQQLLEAQIRLIEAKSDVRGLELRNKDIMQHLVEARDQIKAIDADSEKYRAEAYRLKEVAEELASDQAEFARIKTLIGDRSVEDLDNEIGAEQAKLELIHGVDPSVLRQFDKRAQEIKNLTLSKEKMSAKLEDLSTQINLLMHKWEPEVDKLVSEINDAFSYNFEQISCAGEVGVHKDEDFEQWAIEIKVKFRENETLQLLNQHRQSGGERAVSTIFYLMALQAQAQAPFRVVDEINQGMDPRNERMVHERMVEIACREHTSQYFLITPKLLTGLRYDERMRILCIASGEHMPSEGKKVDFSALVKRQRAAIAAGA